MQTLIKQLEISILKRNPLLAEKLQPGLAADKIRKSLKHAKIEGEVDPIVELYSWRNGTVLDMDLASSKTGFVPETVYQFTDLQTAIVDMKSYADYAKYHSRLSALTGRYFPMLWDGATGWIALDIKPSAHNRVVKIQFEDDKPLREAYSSFAEFLIDAIRANDEGSCLTCSQ